MTLERIDLEGWDRDEAGEDGYYTFIRDDRLAKITVKPVTFADRPDGLMATLRAKDTPHGRSWRETSIAHYDVDEFVDEFEALAVGAT